MITGNLKLRNLCFFVALFFILATVCLPVIAFTESDCADQEELVCETSQEETSSEAPDSSTSEDQCDSPQEEPIDEEEQTDADADSTECETGNDQEIDDVEAQEATDSCISGCAEDEEELVCEVSSEEISSDEDPDNLTSENQCDDSQEEPLDEEELTTADADSTDFEIAEAEGGQTYTTELTPEVVVGADQDTQFTLKIEEVGDSNIAKVIIEGNYFDIQSLDDLLSSCGTWNTIDHEITGNILTIWGNTLAKYEWVTAIFTATTPAVPGIYSFDVDAEDEDGVSNNPETPGEDDQPSVWVAGVLHNVTPSDSIQSAIDIALPYDIINVQPGMYEENLVIKDTTGLLLRSAVKHDAVIDGVNFGRGVTLLEFNPTDHYTISDVRIEGFTFKDIPIPGVGAASTGHGIAMFTDKIIANIVIVDNLFDNTNPLTTENHKGSAILIDNVDRLRIENNTMLDTALYSSATPEEVAAITLQQFFDSNYLNDVVVKGNTIINATRGIWIGEGNDPSNFNRFLNDVLIEGNHIEQIAREGIRADVGAVSGNETLIIRNNQFVDTYRTIRIGASGSGGIVIVESNSITTTAGSSVYGVSVENGQIAIMDNSISGQETGIFVKAGVLNPPVIIDNTFIDNTLQINDTSGSTNLDNILIANIFDRAAVIRDSTTNSIKVPIIFSSIQDAIDSSDSGNTIDVYPGVYNELLLIDNKPLTLQGAGIGISIIDGTGLSESQLIRIRNITAGKVKVDGFTIQNAPLMFNLGDHHRYPVQVAACEDPAEITISNNAIIGSDPMHYWDWGLLVQGTSCHIVINHNVFDGIWRNSVLLERATGPVEVGYNIFLLPDPASPAIFSMSYQSGVNPNNVDSLHWYHNNSILSKTDSAPVRRGIVVASAYGTSYGQRTGGAYSNLFIDNNLIGNITEVGIQLEVDGPGGGFTNVQISNNEITGLGLPGDDSSRGIRLLGNVIDPSISGNILTGLYRGIWLTGTFSEPIYPTGVMISNNNLSGNAYGVLNLNPSDNANARNNWWGDPYGPSTHPNDFTPPAGYVLDPETNEPADGDGAAVSEYVLFDPWMLTAPVILDPLPVDPEESDTAFVEYPELKSLRSLIFGFNPVINNCFVLKGTHDLLLEARVVYQRHLRLFEERKNILIEEKYAVDRIELAVARAAILALENRLLISSCYDTNPDMLYEAYEEALLVLNKYGKHLSLKQMVIVNRLINDIASMVHLSYHR